MSDKRKPEFRAGQRIIVPIGVELIRDTGKRMWYVRVDSTCHFLESEMIRPRPKARKP